MSSDAVPAVPAVSVWKQCAVRIRPYRGRLALAVVTLFASTAATVAGPALVGYGIDHGIQGGHGRTLDVVAAIFVATSTTAFLLGRQQIKLVGWLGERFCFDLRQEVFNHLQKLSLDFYDSERTGRLVARMTADFDATESLVQQGLIVLVMNLLLFCFAIVVLLVLSWQLFLVTLVAAPVLFFASRRFHHRSQSAYQRVRDSIGQTLVTVQEGLTGVRVIQAFAREEAQVNRFDLYNKAQLDANIDAVRVGVRYFPVVEISAVVTTAGMVGLGGLLVHEQLVALGTVVAFVLYVNSLFDPVQQMSQLFNQLQSSGAALRKLFGILVTEPSIVEADGAVDLPSGGELTLSGVSFTYAGSAGRPVLSGVDLTVPPGEKLALVGPTGAGKSTLAKLIARLYDPTSGVVALGGVDLRRATFASLTQRIVMVPQEGFLFRGTVLDNVRVGRGGATDEEAQEALRSIGVLRRFEAMAGGLEAVVEGRGSTMSAGERQLVSLARAALANPDLLILDEATSSLDPGTEADVEAAFAAVSRGRTTIVIAHRLQTAAAADRIAVVDGGGIVELGTHDELIALAGRYAGMYSAWDAEAAVGTSRAQ